MDLGEIFKYTNEQLLEGSLSSISDIIQYLDEGQNIIAQKAKIEAPIVEYVLTSSEIQLPSDFATLNKCYLASDTDKNPIAFTSVWQGVAELPSGYTQGIVKLQYYKKPTPLVEASQVPEIDSQYHYALAQYAAEMYKLKDEDTEMKNVYRAKFLDSIQTYSTNKNIVTKCTNLWG